MTPEPVAQHGLAVLLQGRGVSEVFMLVEAGLRYMKNQCLKPEQMQRLRQHRDVLARAHDDRMSTNGRELPVYVAVEAHSECQDIADLMKVAAAAKELGCTERHVRRMVHSGLLQREGTFGLLIKSDVLALKQQRKRGA